jgi:hypothetical protein
MPIKFFVSRSGRHYFDEDGQLYFYDRGEAKWLLSRTRTLAQVVTEGRLEEVQSPDDFVFYARKAYYELKGRL